MSKIDYDYLYVMVEKFNKMCNLMPCKKQVTIEQTTHMFFANVWVHFGLPTSIISDRDSLFLRNFLSHLWELMENKLKNSTYGCMEWGMCDQGLTVREFSRSGGYMA